MDALHYDPLDYYVDVVENRHKKNVEELFLSLTQKSCVDVEANKKTVSLYDAKLKKIQHLQKRTTLYRVLEILFIVIAAAALVLLVYSIANSLPWYLYLITLPLIVALPLVVFLKLRPTRKRTEEILDEEKGLAEELLQKAWSEMQPLNALFDDGMTLSLFEKTMPEFKFEKSFSYLDYREMMDNCDMPIYSDNERTVLRTLPGRYRKNPFVYLRSLVHKMGSETYHGYKVIHWTETYRDSNGRTRTRTRSQTLHATVIKPKPFYSVETNLLFGAQGAPNLSFTREGRNINLKSDKSIQRFVKRGARKLRKKSRKALSEGKSFMTMTNSDFEVLFGADDRDHEVDFRVMFTPLAQTNMVELILSDDTFGDDFDFSKFKRYNVIRSDHAQSWAMDTSADNYRSHSYEDAKNKFISFNLKYFKSVYFDFAPLMAIPIYQDEPNSVFDVPEGAKQHYSNHEYEVIANSRDRQLFVHPNSKTEAILKTDFISSDDARDTVQVTAYSYDTVQRIDVIMVLGGDGRMHGVPVPWLEYVPIINITNMQCENEPLSKGAKEETVGEKIMN